MKRFLIVLLAVVLVAVIGLEVYMLFDRGQTESAGGPAPSATFTPIMTLPPMPTAIPATPEPTAVPATPVPTAIPVTPVPLATATPAPTAVPKPTVSPVPTATPEPTATPAPTMPPDLAGGGSGGETGGGGGGSSFTPSSGSFSSGTGTGLDLIVSWQTEDIGNGVTRLYVSGSASSYSLDVMGTKATISFNGQTATASCSSISQGETASRTVNGLFSTSLDVPQGSAGTLTVDWAFKGSYGGTSLPTISASGSVDA